MITQGYSDDNSLRICKVGYEDEHKFGKSLSCGKFQSCYSCVFCNAKFFKYGQIRHI